MEHAQTRHVFVHLTPWIIYLFITDKTSQGIKLLLQTSEVASDVSIWSSHCPVNQVDCWTTATTGKLACTAGAEREERCKICLCEIVQRGSLCDHRNYTAGLCEYVFRSTMYSAELFLERRNLVNFFVHFFNFKSENSDI